MLTLTLTSGVSIYTWILYATAKAELAEMTLNLSPENRTMLVARSSFYLPLLPYSMSSVTAYLVMSIIFTVIAVSTLPLLPTPPFPHRLPRHVYYLHCHSSKYPTPPSYPSFLPPPSLTAYLFMSIIFTVIAVSTLPLLPTPPFPHRLPRHVYLHCHSSKCYVVE